MWLVALRERPAPLPLAAASPQVASRRAVAVLGFKNLSGQPETAWLSTAFAEMLTTELAAGGRLRTIPGENVGRMKVELALSDAESLAQDTLARVARNLGTDMVLLGSYVTLPGDQIRLDLRLQDVATGETVAALGESGTQTGLVELVTRAGSRLRQAMGVGEPPTAEAGGLAAGAPSSLEAQRLYAEGLARLRAVRRSCRPGSAPEGRRRGPGLAHGPRRARRRLGDAGLRRQGQAGRAEGVRSLGQPLPRGTSRGGRPLPRNVR